ncbi:MAG: hypothetical protein JO235_10025 [Chroococcidiopsidaceae cyanobacterium CP_BM_RX_35]|nr:hypothetical protein [Chroococcidiopsidaceae cyanobacterium CP_BM_RX_35]
MNELKQPSGLLPADDSIIVKIPQGTQIFHGNNVIFNAANFSLHISTKEFVDKVAIPIHNQIRPQELFQQGTKVEILEPEKKWVTGKIHLRLVFEFIPDEPEINKTSGEFVSPLDEIRNRSI